MQKQIVLPSFFVSQPFFFFCDEKESNNEIAKCYYPSVQLPVSVYSRSEMRIKRIIMKSVVFSADEIISIYAIHKSHLTNFHSLN